jgi:hypothetical protein
MSDAKHLTFGIPQNLGMMPNILHFKCKMLGIRHIFWGIPNVRCLASDIYSGEFQM